MRVVFGRRLRPALAVMAVLVASVALCAAPATAANGAGTPGSVSVVCPPGGSTRVGNHFLGILRPQRSELGTEPCPAPAGASPQAVSSEAPYTQGATPPLATYGGPVLGTDPDGGQVTVTPIYWVPSGYRVPSNYQDVVNGFLGNVAADSGRPSNVFSVATQYTDASGSNNIRYHVASNTAILDNANPTLPGCVPDAGPVYADNSGYTSCIDDAQVEGEVRAVLTRNGLPSDASHLYPVLLPQGVEACMSSANGAAGGSCTTNTSSPVTGQGFCGYHSSTTVGGSPAIYNLIPFPIYHSPTRFGCGSENGPGIQAPNGDANADTTISVLSHEMIESITDPFGNAWNDSSGNEIADDCQFLYGVGFGGNPGAQYNQTINGAHYFVQEEFSNANYVPHLSGCVQRNTAPTPTTITLGASPDTAVGVAAIALFATLAPSTAGGTVTFTDGSAVLPGCQDLPVTSGVATCVTTFPTAGVHTITTTYHGDATHAPTTASTPITVDPNANFFQIIVGLLIQFAHVFHLLGL